jgi:putative PIG3 family NAD(P)H quinone oxidoreductase
MAGGLVSPAMRAVLIENQGPDATLRIGDSPSLEMGPGDLRIATRAFALNRGDLMQRIGMYPPPPGASPVMGLECAGEVVEVGAGVSGWTVGDRAMVLLAGGGYAEETVVHAGSAMRVPDGMSWTDAAAIPEVFLTVHLTVFQLAAFPDGGTLLVHGGGSGIGTAATQMVKAVGGRVITTAGSDEKCAQCRELGADVTVNYREASFAEAVAEATGGTGVDVVLDHIGGRYLADNLASLKVGGRLVLIGLMGGAKAEISLAQVMLKRLQVIGSTLRARPVEEKAAIVADFEARFGAALSKGEIRPVVDQVFAMDEIEAAHQRMEASDHFGKLVLTT